MKSFEQQAAETVRTLVAWCTVLSVFLIAVLGVAIYGFATASGAQDAAVTVAKRQATDARRVATLAQQTAAVARTVSLSTVQRLQNEVSGECYRVNYLRWQIDHASYAGWRRDFTTARFLHRLPGASIRGVAHAFHFAARSWYFLPLTDCAAATGSPATYRAPVAVPFNRVPKILLRRALANPPQPPATP